MFVVTMRRWGDTESHSYVLGVFTTKVQAKFAGEAECSWRGGKYEPAISEHIVDSPVHQKAWKHHMGILDG